MIEYLTTGDVAKLCGISGTAARNKIAAGEWKPSARTVRGDALFTQARANQIVKQYANEGKS